MTTIKRSVLQGVLISSAILSAGYFATTAYRFVQTRQYNAAVLAEDHAAAAAYPGDRGLFAKAYADQQRGERDAARAGYNLIARSDEEDLATSVLFNLGNSYVRQALQYDLESESDLALPLIELAKMSYRSALRVDSNNWDARLNLEHTLLRFPDANPRVPMEVEGRRGAVRTIISADSEENLP